MSLRAESPFPCVERKALRGCSLCRMKTAGKRTQSGTSAAHVRMSYLSCEDLSSSSVHREADILAAWTQNAAPWTDVVRRREIDGRRLVTDDAVLQVIAAHKPASVLDIGCGEGWLARAVADLGCPVTGVDAVPELIERARQAGGGIFYVASFQDIVAAKLAVTADLSVCNFSCWESTPSRRCWWRCLGSRVAGARS